MRAMSDDPPGQAEAPAAPPRLRPRRPLQSAQQLRERRRRLALSTVFGLAFVLMVNALLGENGYVATVRAEREYAAAQARLGAARRVNDALLAEIRRLRETRGALEEAARRLGMIYPGETLIVVKDARPAAGPDPK
jgi:cell division protein FtsB